MSDPELEEIIRKKLESLANAPKQDHGSVTVTKENFNEIINGEKPAIVDFWADWCYPCKIMHPIFEKLAKQYGDRMKFGRLNVDEYGEIAARYKVFSIPTFLVFARGQPIETIIGAVGEKPLQNAILKHLS